jgi:hypothetical protein
MEVPPEKLKMGFNPLAKYSGDKNDVAKYRKLKSMAIAASDHVKSGEFFAYEMMAKRGSETKGFFPLLFNYLYGLLSGYGQSYIQPLKGFGFLWASFTFWNWTVIGSSISEGSRFGLSALLSLLNSMPLIGLFAKRITPPAEHNSWLQTMMDCIKEAKVNIDYLTTIGIIEQFLGAILLFLLLLGLRNAFRLK